VTSDFPAGTRADALLVPFNVTREDARSAALTLADHAADAAELRDWLEMLGLLDAEPRRKPPGPRTGGAGMTGMAIRAVLDSADPEDLPGIVAVLYEAARVVLGARYRRQVLS
jgi:hypothetical protein